MIFTDRIDAGKQLAAALMDLCNPLDPPVVLAIPRGGVIVAREVAQALHAPLDICLTHKIGAPANPELAIGAVADDGTTVLDRFLIAGLVVPRQYLEAEIERWKHELARRAEVYRRGRARVPVKDRCAIVVDDGVATGSTLLAALRSTRAAGARQVIAAIPVGPAEVVKGELSRTADRVVCLYAPIDFWAVGAFYRRFDQVSDEEVIEAITNAE